jgi:GNAT superfamily N-acetyltransferase
MKLLLREAITADAEDIARLSNQLGYPIPADATLLNLKTISENKNELVSVAVHEEKIVGWIHVFQTLRLESGPFCEIGGLVVDDQYRRMGIGKMLVEHIKPWCINKGTPALRVRSNVKRKEAHEFYFQLGFGENKQQKVFEIDLSSGS